MLIYVASPYSHPKKIVMEQRYVAATKFSMIGIRMGHLPFSPITYCHFGAQLLNYPTNAVAWAEFALKMLSECDALLVLGMKGWDESTGVQMEVSWMHDDLSKPCYIWLTDHTAIDFNEKCTNFWESWMVRIGDPGLARKIEPNVVGKYKIEGKHNVGKDSSTN